MKYTQKRKIVDAVQYKGTNDIEVLLFDARIEIDQNEEGRKIKIKVHENVYNVFRTDFIVRDAQNTIYIVKSDTFKKEYEKPTLIEKIVANKTLIDVVVSLLNILIFAYILYSFTVKQ